MNYLSRNGEYNKIESIKRSNYAYNYYYKSNTYVKIINENLISL